MDWVQFNELIAFEASQKFSFFNFRYVKHPEYLKVGQRLVFREGRTKAVGNVTKIVAHIPLAGTGQTSTNQSRNQKSQKMMGQRNQGQAKKKEEEMTKEG